MVWEYDVFSFTYQDPCSKGETSVKDASKKRPRQLCGTETEVGLES